MSHANHRIANSNQLLRRYGPAGCGWLDGVVPLAVELIGLELWCDGAHLGVADLDATRVAVGVGFGVD